MAYATSLTAADLAGLGIEAYDLTGRGTPGRPRKGRPPGVITHSPSVTFARRVRDDFERTHGRPATPHELDRAAAERLDRAIYQPHALLGQTGAVYLLARDDTAAQHAGTLAAGCPAGNVYRAHTWREWASPSDGSGWRLHGRDGREVYDWWYAAWPGAKSPLDVYPWRGQPNRALGVDILPDTSGRFSEVQRKTWATLVRAWASLHRFPLGAATVTTHSLAAPCERGTVLRTDGQIVGVHWDPPARHWSHAAALAALVSP